MRLLLSVYACDPYAGSEPGIGWNWVISLNELDFKVVVLTRENNRKNIESFLLKTNVNLKNVSFVYYDLPFLFIKYKKYLGVYLYYELWQLFVFFRVRRLVNFNEIDFIHHLTFGVIRHPVYLSFLKKPFVIGPCGGGEFTPFQLYQTFSRDEKFKEIFRLFVTKLSYLRPSLFFTFLKSDFIFLRSVESFNSIPKIFRKKSYVFRDIGVTKSSVRYVDSIDKNKPFKLLFVGRLVYWKGLKLAILTFNRFHKLFPNSIFLIVGDGPYRNKLVKLIDDLNLSNVVELVGSVNHDTVSRYFQNCDVFFFPSLHDAGPLVVYEAVSENIPIVSLKIGGILELLSENYPSLVSVNNLTFEQIIDSLVVQLFRLSTDPKYVKVCKEFNYNLAVSNTWTNTIISIYSKFIFTREA